MHVCATQGEPRPQRPGKGHLRRCTHACTHVRMHMAWCPCTQRPGKGHLRAGCAEIWGLKDEASDEASDKAKAEGLDDDHAEVEELDPEKLNTEFIKQAGMLAFSQVHAYMQACMHTGRHAYRQACIQAGMHAGRHAYRQACWPSPRCVANHVRARRTYKHAACIRTCLPACIYACTCVHAGPVRLLGLDDAAGRPTRPRRRRSPSGK